MHEWKEATKMSLWYVASFPLDQYQAWLNAAHFGQDMARVDTSFAHLSRAFREPFARNRKKKSRYYLLSGLSRIFRKPFANVYISRKVPFAQASQIYACGPRLYKTFHGFLHDSHICYMYCVIYNNDNNNNNNKNNNNKNKNNKTLAWTPYDLCRDVAGTQHMAPKWCHVHRPLVRLFVWKLHSPRKSTPSFGDSSWPGLVVKLSTIYYQNEKCKNFWTVSWDEREILFMK